MTAAEFTHIIKKGGKLQDSDLKLAEELAVRFPYFTLPYILKAKADLSASSESVDEWVAAAAVRVPHRARLKQLLYSDWDLLLPTLPEEEPIPTRDTAVEQIENDDDHADTDQKSSGDEAIVPATTTPRSANVLRQLEENLSKLKQDVQSENSLYVEGLPESSEQVGGSAPLEELSQRDLVEAENDKRKEQLEVIERFTRENIRISQNFDPNDNQPLTEDLSLASTQINDSVISESFAKLLVKQKKTKKAIEIYRKLQLKYPDKKTYFADCIKKLELE